MQRSLLLFQNSIHSEETYRVYKYELDRFITHFKLRDYNAFASMDAKMLQTMIEDYIMEKKSQGKARSTIKTPLSVIEYFETGKKSDLQIDATGLEFYYTISKTSQTTNGGNKNNS